MPKATSNRSAKDIALSLLGRRDHTAAELGEKLRRRGIPDKEINTVIERLTDTGIIDNERAAQTIIRGELRKRPIGRMRLMAKLRQRRVPHDLITRCLEELDESWEREQCLRAIERWFRIHSRSGHWRESLTRHLRSRGFAWDCIRRTLRFSDTMEYTDGESVSDGE